MYKVIIGSTLLVLLAGCSSFSEKELSARHAGIVDACYTTIEYAPQDKVRIEQYLVKQQQNKVLTVRESNLIKLCLKRTEGSPKWEKEK